MNTAELKRPDISVLIPCYNCATTLKRAVESVLNQPGVDIEIILIDDASTDDTGRLMDELATHYANICAVHRKENGRIAAALNNGAEVAKGRYIVRLDSDDWLEKGCLARMLAAIEANPKVGFVYGCRKYYGRRSDTYIPKAFNRADFDVHNAAGYCYLFRRDVWDMGIRWEALGTFGGAVIDLEDWQHLLKMMNAGLEGMALPDTLVLHYTFGWTGTWQELKANEGAALAELKRRFPSVKAVNL